MLTEEWAARFLRAKEDARRSPKTLETYGFVLRRFARALRTLPRTPEAIEHFLGTIEGEPETVDCYYRVLNTFYKWLARRRRVRNPMPLVERPRRRAKVPAILELGDLPRLLDHPGHSQRDRTLLYFLVDSGWRIGEAHKLRHSMIQE
ncbi:MAG: hypothetical protein Q8R28_05050, partial [Dehalococcoidia bacterium]|nr:hypothetical protein [Dehalococcoidia bacterium]